MTDTVQEINGGIYRLGYTDQEAGFSNNTYLIREQEGSVSRCTKNIILKSLKKSGESPRDKNAA